MPRRAVATRTTVGLLVTLLAGAVSFANSAPSSSYELNDSHFHLTNYVQEGTDIRDFLKIMGNRVGRVALLCVTPLYIVGALLIALCFRTYGDDLAMVVAEAEANFGRL